MIKFTLDVDEDLHNQVIEEAQQNERSVAAQYRIILKERYK